MLIKSNVLSIEMHSQVVNASLKFDSFLILLEENFEVISKMLNLYLESKSYYTEEVEEVLGKKILDSLIDDVEYSENIILINSKYNQNSQTSYYGQSNLKYNGFSLRKRVEYILNEYLRFRDLKKIINDKKFSDILLNKITKSTEESILNFEIASEEMINTKDHIKGFGINISIGINDNGWQGKYFLIGLNREISLLEALVMHSFSSKLGKLLGVSGNSSVSKSQLEYLLKESKNKENNKLLLKYQGLNEVSQSSDVESLWMTEELEKYCQVCNLGGKIEFLDPSLEDFILIKNK